MAHLSTPRLIIRKLVADDAADIFEYASDPEVARYVPWEAHRSIDETRRYLGEITELAINGHPHTWGVVMRENQRVIGTIGYHDIDLRNRTAEIGYAFTRKYWNQGFATEALREMLRYGIEELLLERITARTISRNIASWKAMERVGMIFEGTLRSETLIDERRYDVRIYSLTS